MTRHRPPRIAPPAGPTTSRPIERHDADVRHTFDDHVVVEEPLELRLELFVDGLRLKKSLSITMRTPGDDFALAAGFLWTEGIITAADQIARIAYCGDGLTHANRNIVGVTLTDDAHVDLDRLQRHFYTTSSCGVCGKASLDALATTLPYTLPHGPSVAPSVLTGLPRTLRDAQDAFDQTGGLHAAGLFSPDGDLLRLCEDVGRHNAVDKVLGHSLLDGLLPLHDAILMVSGRTSFEIIQKALMAGVPLVAAVSAPSSLAVDLADRHGMTLIGFLRGERFNVYTAAHRIAPSETPRETP